jgi:hypothetical protein|tara:strand:+ start:587 stop:769 length:183 start_codon:yes stop_codon:yes gene_type:complete
MKKNSIDVKMYCANCNLFKSKTYGEYKVYVAKDRKKYNRWECKSCTTYRKVMKDFKDACK